MTKYFVAVKSVMLGMMRWVSRKPAVMLGTQAFERVLTLLGNFLGYARMVFLIEWEAICSKHFAGSCSQGLFGGVIYRFSSLWVLLVEQ